MCFRVAYVAYRLFFDHGVFDRALEDQRQELDEEPAVLSSCEGDKILLLDIPFFEHLVGNSFPVIIQIRPCWILFVRNYVRPIFERVRSWSWIGDAAVRELARFSGFLFFFLEVRGIEPLTS